MATSTAATYAWDRPFEPVGRAFFTTRLSSVDLSKAAGTEKNNEDAAATNACKVFTQDEIDELVEARDFYRLLDLADGVDATPEDIRRNYRAMLLRYHPDKTGVSDDDPHFLMIQEAYDTLSDPEKKRGFDSQYEFDESFPSSKSSGGENFFKAWGPVFKRNGRFSLIKPVPELGDIDSPGSHVNAFWSFWRSFKSWRDFSSQDEHQINAGDAREDKRWMMQENQQNRRKLKKKEMRRITEMVELAFKLDPRRKRIAEAAAKAKAEAKAAKQRSRMSAAQLKKAKAEEEKAAKEAALQAERDAKKAAKLARKELNRKKREVRLQIQEVCDGFDTLLKFEENDYITLAKEASLEDLQALLEQCKADGNPQALSVKMAQVKGEVQADMEAKAQEKEQAKRNAAEKVKAAEAAKAPAPWTTEEESWLAKAMVKVPTGTRRRWQEIADYMVNVGKCARRTGKECVTHAERMKKAELVARATKQSADPAPAGDAVAAAKAAAASANSTEWTPEQQKQLEAAMAKYPASMDKKARWTSIAAAVDGKKAKECVARVKEIRAQLMAQTHS